MNADQLRRYIEDAEKATHGPWHAPGLGEVLAPDYRCVVQVCFDHEYGGDGELDCGTEADATHIANASPELFAALCRLAVAAMECAASYDDDTGANPMHDYDAALHELSELP